MQRKSDINLMGLAQLLLNILFDHMIPILLTDKNKVDKFKMPKINECRLF